MPAEALPGRLLLLGSAYAPAALIVGFRTVPHAVGWCAIALGAGGIAIWVAFLRWLSKTQHRTVEIGAAEPIDAEVTGYIASYLLPVVAAGSPTAGDIAAYVLCGVLLLVVAFVADLGAINPVIYLFGLRAVRADIDGEHLVLLAREVPRAGARVEAARKLGVIRLL